MKTISYLGGVHVLQHGGDEADSYHGSDEGNPINLAVGEEAEVSDETAARLGDDFPGCFEIDGHVAGSRRKPSKAAPAAGGGDLREQLLGHKRDDLNAAARELGVDAPEALPNKAAVVDAIVAAKGE